MERDIERKYFHLLRDILINSSLYIGKTIERIDLVNMIYFKKNNFSIIEKLFTKNDFDSLVNFTFNDENEGLELLEIILIKDVLSSVYIACVIDNSELFSDKYLYSIHELNSEQYNKLIGSINHKGSYVYA